MRIGIHTSIAGSLEKAALRAAELGANTFQIFSGSPRAWPSGPLDREQVQRFRETRERLDLRPLAVHDNYLINLAAADETVRLRSVAAFRLEIERAIALGAEYLIAHPGSAKGRTPEEGIEAVARGLAEAARGLRSKVLTILLENTAGSGAQIGRRFEELARLRELASRSIDFETGYCLDTAHCLAAGYDVAGAAGLLRTVTEIESVLGLNEVRVIHANDSKVPLGSRVDRHAHIGRGQIGRSGFRRILTHHALRSKPFILETPVDKPGDDGRNLRLLKRLSQVAGTR